MQKLFELKIYQFLFQNIFFLPTYFFDFIKDVFSFIYISAYGLSRSRWSRDKIKIFSFSEHFTIIMNFFWLNLWEVMKDIN